MSDHSQLIFAHHEPGRGYCECEHCRKLPVDVRIEALWRDIGQAQACIAAAIAYIAKHQTSASHACCHLAPLRAMLEGNSPA